MHVRARSAPVSPGRHQRRVLAARCADRPASPRPCRRARCGAARAAPRGAASTGSARATAARSSVAHPARVARAHRREQVVLDVVAELQREPLDPARRGDAQPADERIVDLDARAEAVVGQDERHHDHVRDERAAARRRTGTARSRRARRRSPTPRRRRASRRSRAACARGFREPALARDEQLVRALHREAEDQAQPAAPAPAAERERIDDEADPARSRRYSASVGYMSGSLGDVRVRVVHAVVPRGPQPRRQRERQEADASRRYARATRPRTMPPCIASWATNVRHAKLTPITSESSGTDEPRHPAGGDRDGRDRDHGEVHGHEREPRGRRLEGLVGQLGPQLAHVRRLGLQLHTFTIGTVKPAARHVPVTILIAWEFAPRARSVPTRMAPLLRGRRAIACSAATCAASQPCACERRREQSLAGLR